MSEYLDRKQVIDLYEKFQPSLAIHVYEFGEALRKLPVTQDSHGEWIPCSERLPEKQGQYYVSGGDKVWICDFLIFSNFKGGWCNDVSNPVVEAWMPLPEPYKKEGEAE